MSVLMVLACESEKAVIPAWDRLESLQKQGLIGLEDAAIVSRREEDTVNIKQAVSLVGAGTMGGAFWGLLSCLIFWPQLARLRGALGRAQIAMLRDIGVDDRFIRAAGHAIRPDSSALFLLVSEVDARRLAFELGSNPATVLRTWPPPERDTGDSIRTSALAGDPIFDPMFGHQVASTTGDNNGQEGLAKTRVNGSQARPEEPETSASEEPTEKRAGAKQMPAGEHR